MGRVHGELIAAYRMNKLFLLLGLLLVTGPFVSADWWGDNDSDGDGLNDAADDDDDNDGIPDSEDDDDGDGVLDVDEDLDGDGLRNAEDDDDDGDGIPDDEDTDDDGDGKDEL